MSRHVYDLYLAGALFDHKDLTGNWLLAEAICQCSQGRYQVHLPQNCEANDAIRDAKNIRNADFAMLIKSDIFLGCMDGTDPDSGTVVEFCFAKALDIPAVLFRSDFRHAGDQTAGGEPWNLMCSNYPRTGSVIKHGMQLWKMFNENSLSFDLKNFYQAMAADIIQSADLQRQKISWIKPENLLEHYQNIIQSIGGDLSEHFPEQELKLLLEQKCRKGLYPMPSDF